MLKGNIVGMAEIGIEIKPISYTTGIDYRGCRFAVVDGTTLVVLACST